MNGVRKVTSQNINIKTSSVTFVALLLPGIRLGIKVLKNVAKYTAKKTFKHSIIYQFKRDIETDLVPLFVHN